MLICRYRTQEVTQQMNVFPGAPPLGSFDTHDALMDGDKGERVVFRVEHENLLSSRARRHGQVSGASR